MALFSPIHGFVKGEILERVQSVVIGRPALCRLADYAKAPKTTKHG